MCISFSIELGMKCIFLFITNIKPCLGFLILPCDFLKSSVIIIIQATSNKYRYYFRFVETLKGFLDEKIVYPILILVNYNYEMNKKGVLCYSISNLDLKIFRFLIFDICKSDSVWRHSLTKTKLKFTKWGISLQINSNFVHLL